MRYKSMAYEREKNVTLRMGEKSERIDFVLIKKEHRHFIQNVKAISEEFQHELLIANIGKNKIMNAMKKICREKKDRFAGRCEKCN